MPKKRQDETKQRAFRELDKQTGFKNIGYNRLGTSMAFMYFLLLCLAVRFNSLFEHYVQNDAVFIINSRRKQSLVIAFLECKPIRFNTTNGDIEPTLVQVGHFVYQGLF